MLNGTIKRSRLGMGGTVHTMTVRELREALEAYDDDAPVVLAYNYGDYHNTEAVRAVRSADELTLTESAYSESGYAVPGRDDDDDDEDEAEDGTPEERPTAVVLR